MIGGSDQSTSHVLIRSNIVHSYYIAFSDRRIQVTPDAQKPDHDHTFAQAIMSFNSTDFEVPNVNGVTYRISGFFDRSLSISASNMSGSTGLSR